MEEQTEDLAQEIRRLRRCVNDLVSVLALPAIWSGGNPSQIVRTTIDVLLAMLCLDFVYMRLNDPAGGASSAAVRIDPSAGLAATPNDIGDILESRLQRVPHEWPALARIPLADADIAIVPLRLGLQGEIGIIVAGSRRGGFPERTERLVLSVAANQAAIGLQEARLLGEQRRLAAELDQQVAERTQELAAANEELKREIAERRRAEDALRESEWNSRLVVDSIPGLVATVTTAGEIDIVNRQLLEYTGRTVEQLKQWASNDTLHLDDRSRVIDVFTRAMATGEPYAVEGRIRRFDGSYRWFDARGSPLRDSDERIIRWYALHIDIEDRKRAEEALSASERNLRQLTETIPEMLWSATAAGAVDYYNARVVDYTGASVTQIMGDGWRRILHPDDVDTATRAWMRCVENGTPFESEIRVFHAADRTYRWCVCRARPLRDDQGRILKWYGTVVDMHDWKRAQEELRDTQAELAHMTRVMTMGALTASIAHEVNQPLAGIITNASTCLRMLAAEPPNIEGARETARRTIRDGNRAAEVITRLRALFSKKPGATETVDLNEAAREVLALVASDLLRSRVILRAELDGGPLLVTGDRVQLQQVIMNLIKNASDSMSSIADRPRQLMISTDREPADRVRLVVKDAGVGFDPHSADKLFHAFYTTKTGGMGIGLAVSRSIIESHGGKLWAEPNDGPGATFSFSIPCRDGSGTDCGDGGAFWASAQRNAGQA